MALEPIRVMISSRCKDYLAESGATFPLSNLRRSLFQQINEVRFFDEPLLQCWINEVEPSKAMTRDVWDECLREIRRAHIVIVLFNGDAGWAQRPNDIGICHGELEASLFSGRDRTHVIQLPLSKTPSARDERFREFVRKELPFSGAPAANEIEVTANVRQTLAEGVSRLARGGATVLRRDSYALGQALEWSKLNYHKRKEEMEAACLAALAERGGRIRDPGTKTATLRINGGAPEVLFRAHAIPASASVAAAREMVGKPFLSDYQLVSSADSTCGPVHLIACQKAATEKQATDLLGFPDATVVTTTFGVYLVDPVQKIQFVLLSNCRDATSTRFAVQRLFDWLERSGEGDSVVFRAKSRTRIVSTILEEINIPGP